MLLTEFEASLALEHPPTELPEPLTALWYDAKGDWSRAHSLVDELKNQSGMAVHAYLHRKEGDASNAAYWYNRASRTFHREDLAEEWHALAEALLTKELE